MNRNEITTEIFRNAPVPKAVISNVVPSIISMIMVLVYNLADTVFIGQTKNDLMVAAVSIATPVFLIFMAVGMLFGIGGTSLISRTLGEGNHAKAKKVSSFCYWTGLSVGIVSMIAIFIFAEPICRMVGASDETIGFTSEYLKIVSFGIPFLIVSNAFSNIIRSEGNAKIAMAGMIMGNLVNIILDPILILGFNWDVAGAAIATVIGNVFSAVYYTKHMLSRRSILSIKPSDYQARGHILTGVFAIGIPASLNSMLMSVSNIIINNVMMDFGDMAVAGLGAAMKVNMIVVMLLIGLGTGVQPLLGYCFGAGNKKRYMAVLRFSLTLAFCLSLIMTLICYIFALDLVKVILDDQAALDFGMSFSRIYIISGPIIGILFVMINAIQSTGAALPSLILSVSRQGLIYMPILFTFTKIFDEARLIALAQPVTDYLAAFLAIILFVTCCVRKFRVMERI
ncbi:MAG: MATE family efflux transporter [Lachnospiraceae bacterium]|nr:MATE family efflux transporter [Lachnospiraceae bacterium]